MSASSAQIKSVKHRSVQVNGIKMHIAEQGEGPLIVLAHGWPELWYSWRHVLPALAAEGYHAVAPDMRGYGQTEAPPNIQDYTQLQFVGDVDWAGTYARLRAGSDRGPRRGCDGLITMPQS
jgi:pimeloyl-ACP methyl ester carboxylesterase